MASAKSNNETLPGGYNTATEIFRNNLFSCENQSHQWTDVEATFGNTDYVNIPSANCSPLMEESDYIPREMTFNSDNMVSVIAYSILFVISSIGNLTVFITLFRNRRRHRKSRVNLFIMHLCIADLVVTFIMLPMETVWHITVAWLAGDIACRLFMFLRTFGFYLGSFILVTISLDRYFAILKPLSLNDADRRGKIMIMFAWIFSIVASLPQSIIFHVENHPLYPDFSQCVTFHFFPTPQHELAYNLFNILSIYVFPLLVIVVSYSLILWEITKKTIESKKSSSKEGDLPPTEYLRRSGMGRIQRAKIRTLRMTIMIVAVFIMCWSPYYIISIWWWVDKTSASQIDPKVSRALFIFAVSNSCMDPIVYGMFTIDFKGEFNRCCCFFKPNQREDITYSYSGLTRRYAVNNTQMDSVSEAVIATDPGRKSSINKKSQPAASPFQSSHFSAIRSQRATGSGLEQIPIVKQSKKRPRLALSKQTYTNGHNQNTCL